MSIFSKLNIFGKHDDDFDLGLDDDLDDSKGSSAPDLNLGLENNDNAQPAPTGIPETAHPTQEGAGFSASKMAETLTGTNRQAQPTLNNPQQSFQGYPNQASPPIQERLQSTHEVILSKELEVISAKIDSLKASLDSVNQRLSNLERIAQSQQTANSWK